MTVKPTLMAVIELGGYPDFTPQYEAAGFHVLIAPSVRKALLMLKKISPAVVVAEFNFQSDFRDRSSNLDSLLATLQSRHPQAKVMVLYDQEHAAPFEQRLRSRWVIDAALAFPIAPQQLTEALERLASMPE